VSVALPDTLKGVRKLFLDTAPVVYYVEKHPRYLPVVQPVFDCMDAGELVAVTSPVTLAECLVKPIELGLDELQRDFGDLIGGGAGIDFRTIDESTGQQAAEFRARYHLGLSDAFQLAVAVLSGCDAFLTNDRDLKRVTEVKVVVLDEMTNRSG
jgi:predicted nucleic acid-binding protein